MTNFSFLARPARGATHPLAVLGLLLATAGAAQAQTNNALAFDGTNDYVALPSSTPVPVGSSAYTIEAWIKPNAMGVYGIIGWGNYGSYSQVNALRLDANGVYNYWWNNDLYAPTGSLAGAWHHVAATFDGTTRRIYIDGVMKAQDTPTTLLSVPNANNLRIGSTCPGPCGGEYFPGSIDEVRVYSVGLTAAQVQADMYSTTAAVPGSVVAYFNMDQGTAGSSNPSLTSLTNQANANPGTLTNFGLAGTSSNWVRSFPTITGISPASGAVGNNVTLTGTNLTDATGFAVNGTSTAGFTTPASDLTATVTVPTGATTGPVSVASATLTKYNGPAFTLAAQTNNALAFDGADDYVHVGTALPASSLFTLEAWVNPTTLNNGFNVLLNGDNFPTGTVHCQFLNNGQLRFTISGMADMDSPFTVPLGRWSHVAVVYSATAQTLQFYLNGTLVGGTLTYAGGTAVTSQAYSLGAWLNGGSPQRFFAGRYDEIRVYNAALTAANIQADMFSTSAALPASLKAYYSFDQGTAGGNNAGLTSLTDQSGTGNAGTLNTFALTGTSSNWVRSFPTITGISPVSGPVGTSVSFSGTNLNDATSFAFNGTNAAGVAVASDLLATATVPSGATTGLVSLAASALAKYNGPVFTLAYPDLVISTAGFTIPNGIYNNITVASGGGGTPNGDVTVNTALVVQSGGTLADGCSLFTGGGTFTLQSGGTLNICRPRGILSSPNTALGNLGAVRVLGTRSFSPDASYVYSGGQSQDTGDGLPAQVRNLTVGTSTDISLTNPLAVAQVLTLSGAGNLATAGNALTLLSTAAGTALVVNSGSGTVVGAATVQRYLDASGNTGTSGYRHYAAPVGGATVASLSTSAYGGSFTAQTNTAYNTADPNLLTLATYPNVFGYDESKIAASPAISFSDFDKGYQSPASTGSALTVGRGYAVQIGNAEKVQFTGTLNTGGSTIGGLTRAAGGSAGAASAGWALVGNPYPAPLDWGTVAGSQLSGVDAAAYVFQSTSAYAGRYTSFINGIGANSGLLAAGQGFFVRTSAAGTTGSIALTNANRATTYGATPKFQRTTADVRPQLRLSLALGSAPATIATAQDETFVYFEQGATSGFDGQYDAYKLPNPSGYYLGTAAVVPAGTPDTGLSIDSRAPLTTTNTTIPVWLSVPAGTYTLTATALLNFAPAGTQVYLRDALLGTLTDLAAAPSYSFGVAANAPSTGRFTLIFGSATPLATTSAALGQVVASLYPNPTDARDVTLAVTGLPTDVRTLDATLTDALGRPVGRYTLPASQGAARASLPTQGLASGLYLLRLTPQSAQGAALGTLPTQRLSVR